MDQGSFTTLGCAYAHHLVVLQPNQSMDAGGGGGWFGKGMRYDMLDKKPSPSSAGQYNVCTLMTEELPWSLRYCKTGSYIVFFYFPQDHHQPVSFSLSLCGAFESALSLLRSDQRPSRRFQSDHRQANWYYYEYLNLTECLYYVLRCVAEPVGDFADKAVGERLTWWCGRDLDQWSINCSNKTGNKCIDGGAVERMEMFQFQKDKMLLVLLLG